jgi:hypothetical protein
MKRGQTLAVTWALLAGLVLSGCKNGNLFGGLHKKGTGDTASVMSDAKAALSQREFSNAKSYYESVLAKEPGNAEALYGAAVATMGSAGLDLGILLSNVIASNSGAPAAHVLSSNLKMAAMRAGASAQDPSSLLYGIDYVALNRALDKIICYLVKIRRGETDGSVKKDDINVLVSIAITSLLRAVTRPYISGLIDIRTQSDGRGYTFVILADQSTVSNNCDVVDRSAKDIVMAIQAVREAAVTLKQSAGDTLYDIQTDIDDARVQYKNQLASYPAACTEFIQNVNLNTYDAFAENPGDCLSK